MQKRCFDVLFALVGITISFPVMLVIALLIFLEDRHGVMFLQSRLGYKRKEFRIFKFRTFHNGEITRVGRYLRKTGLDELPQFLNILKGDMSLVGPRPLTQYDVQRLGWQGARYDVRWSATPGVTGLAQIHAGKGKKLSWFYDNQYLKKQCFSLDLQIIFLSVLMNIFNKYRVRAWLADVRKKRRHNWLTWQNFFSQRRFRDIPSIVKEPRYRALPASLARSLAIFQLGESGGGTIVGQVSRSRIRGVNQHYIQAMRLFVEEEHRHAEILARCVMALGGKTIKVNWTDKLFVFSRRLLGVRLKVLVLLAAEIIGLTYYRLIATYLPPSDLRFCLESLVKDEQSHLVFHCEFLRTQTRSRLAKLVFTTAWYVTTCLALLVVFIDHRRAIMDLGISPVTLTKRWLHHVVMANELVVADRPRFYRLSAIDKVNI